MNRMPRAYGAALGRAKQGEATMTSEGGNTIGKTPSGGAKASRFLNVFGTERATRPWSCTTGIAA